jgi:hypothetical protein
MKAYTPVPMILGTIAACVRSIEAPLNIRDVTPEQLARLGALADELHDLQQEIACGPRSNHEVLAPGRPIATKRLKAKVKVKLPKVEVPMHPVSKREAARLLRALGWAPLPGRGVWRTEKHGLKRHTAQGLTFAEAASIECIEFKRSRS